MIDNKEKNHIKNKILDQIKKGHVKMRPKLYFILQTLFKSEEQRNAVFRYWKMW